MGDSTRPTSAPPLLEQANSTTDLIRKPDGKAQQRSEVPAFPHASRTKNKLKTMSGGLMFALGISWCASTEYAILKTVHILPYLYVTQIIPLLIYRFISYYKQHLHHYTLELCYFSNALLILNIIAFPKSQFLFLICFGLMNGPVLMANVVYRCSMLFGDLQRFISWNMHVFPAVVVFALRWLPHDKRFSTCQEQEQGTKCLYTSTPALLFILTLSACIGHAILYNLYVWKLSPASTRNHPQYENSYLYLTRRLGDVTTLVTLLNCFGSRGRIFSYTLMNQVFNGLCIALTYAAWKSFTFHLIYLLMVIFTTAYYAGTFYVFVSEKATRGAASKALHEGVNREGVNHISQQSHVGENQVVPIVLVTTGGREVEMVSTMSMMKPLSSKETNMIMSLPPSPEAQAEQAVVRVGGRRVEEGVGSNSSGGAGGGGLIRVPTPIGDLGSGGSSSALEPLPTSAGSLA